MASRGNIAMSTSGVLYCDEFIETDSPSITTVGLPFKYDSAAAENKYIVSAKSLVEGASTTISCTSNSTNHNIPETLTVFEIHEG